jgi:hypothetical protein
LNARIKAFFFYAYVYFLLFMFNSLLITLAPNLSFNPALVAGVLYAVTPPVLFVAYRFSLKHFLGLNTTLSNFLKGWLYQFLPFVLGSVVVSLLLKQVFARHSVAVFVTLNAEFLIIYLTFTFSVGKIVKGA